MKRFAVSLAVALTFCGAGGSSGVGSALAQQSDEYVEVTAGGTEIYMSSSTSSPVVTQAIEGDVFRLRTSEGDWFVVLLFAGEARYIAKSAARPVAHVPTPPDDESVRRQIFRGLLAAERRAQQEADRQISITDSAGRPDTAGINANTELARRLTDQHKLDLCHRFGVHATINSKIVTEGIEKGGWQ